MSPSMVGNVILPTIGKLKEKFIEKYVFCKNMTYI